MSRCRGWRVVKSQQTYTVDEAARNQRVSKGTVRRWLKYGLKHLAEKRPLLIIGADLIEFLRSRSVTKRKCRADEFFCFSCKEPRRPAFGAVELRQNHAGRHRLKALCCECSTVMHKAASLAMIDALNASGGISMEKASEPLKEGNEPV